VTRDLPSVCQGWIAGPGPGRLAGQPVGAL